LLAPNLNLHDASGWYAILPTPPPANHLTGKQIADWVVVGAGVTGLAAARRLGELKPDARIILLDEYRVGYGTSGRNAGFIIDTPHLTEAFDDTANRRVSRLVIAGLAELEHQVKKHEIECEWSPRGHLTAVVESERVDRLRGLCDMLDAAGEEYEWLDAAALAEVVGTNHYHAAVLTPRTVLVNPAAMCRGLGDTLPENVELYEESPVLKVTPGNPVQLECADGSVTAPNVFLTTNAFVTKLGLLKREVFPMIACGSLSRPLSEGEQEAMGGAPDWGITSASTLRRTRSNRILFRHGLFHDGEFRLSPARRRHLLKKHKEGLRRRYPMLDKLEFEHTWAGVFCMTRNWASVFGKIESGVFASLGYAGIGLPRGTISGKLLAEYATGDDSDLMTDVEALSHPERLPPKPLLSLGVHARTWWYRRTSGAEL
jgi:glycine/D-amino acid oxidase-like deaminating enzyme